MEALTAFLVFVAALSMATERIVETLKGFPGLTTMLSQEKGNPAYEEYRKAAIHVLAIAVGTVMAYLAKAQVAKVAGLEAASVGIPICLVFGAMASGGSGLWNSALDIVREINRQKKLLTGQQQATTVTAEQAALVAATRPNTAAQPDSLPPVKPAERRST